MSNRIVQNSSSILHCRAAAMRRRHRRGVNGRTLSVVVAPVLCIVAFPLHFNEMWWITWAMCESKSSSLRERKRDTQDDKKEVALASWMRSHQKQQQKSCCCLARLVALKQMRRCGGGVAATAEKRRVEGNRYHSSSTRQNGRWIEP